MAIALVLNPAWVVPTTGTSATSAAFSPVAGSLIIVESQVDAGTTPTISDSVGLSWTAIGTAQGPSGAARVMAWWAYTTVGRTGMTVTVDWSTSNAKAIKVTTFTGTADTGAVISKTQSSSTANPLNLTVTTTNDGCRIMGSAIDWNARGAPTSSDVATSYHRTGLISGTSVLKAANTSGTGQSVTLNIVKGTVSSQGADWGYKTWEIVPGAAGPTPVSGADALSGSEGATPPPLEVTLTPPTDEPVSTFSEGSLTALDADLTGSDSATGTDAGPTPTLGSVTSGGTIGTSTTASHVVTTPPCAVGNLLVASLTLNGGHGTVTEPPGWNRQVPTTITDDGFMTLLVYTRVATAGDVAGATYTWTTGSAVRSNWGCAVVRGQDPANPVNATAAVLSGNNNATTATISTTVNNTLVLSLLALDSATEVATPNDPLRRLWDPAGTTTATGQVNAGAFAIQPGTGTGNYRWNWATSLDRKHVLLAIAPAASMVVAGVSINGADTGTGTDAVSQLDAGGNQSGADAGTGTDRATALARQVATDTATATEASSLTTLTPKAGADAGTATEGTPTMVVAVSGVDPVTGTDAVTNLSQGGNQSDADSGAATDAVALLARTYPTEAMSAGEGHSLTQFKTGADTAGASELLAAMVAALTGGDTAKAAQTIKVLTGPQFWSFIGADFRTVSLREGDAMAHGMTEAGVTVRQGTDETATT